ncbi:hypothetical protein E2C01_000885 [Portunus trituberculatus]|uniref:Uncharacterized protein n=1 Tax=Portunus trituberculatus TaxID=210409 RepID=A0A5B7CL43_PORTR|nr:hypothetical protein [Portunus trituberculatus]
MINLVPLSAGRVEVRLATLPRRDKRPPTPLSHSLCAIMAWQKVNLLCPNTYSESLLRKGVLSFVFWELEGLAVCVSSVDAPESVIILSSAQLEGEGGCGQTRGASPDESSPPASRYADDVWVAES